MRKFLIINLLLFPNLVFAQEIQPTDNPSVFTEIVAVTVNTDDLNNEITNWKKELEVHKDMINRLQSQIDANEKKILACNVARSQDPMVLDTQGTAVIQ